LGTPQVFFSRRWNGMWALAFNVGEDLCAGHGAPNVALAADQRTSPKGGKRACRCRLGNDRSPRHSRGTIASAEYASRPGLSIYADRPAFKAHLALPYFLAFDAATRDIVSAKPFRSSGRRACAGLMVPAGGAFMDDWPS
jgi:hypothetical protein